MSDLSLYLKITELPNSIKAEILHYMDFLLTKRIITKKKSIKHPKAGCMKGTFKMSHDFDEPLDDFKEYME